MILQLKDRINDRIGQPEKLKRSVPSRTGAEEEYLIVGSSYGEDTVALDLNGKILVVNSDPLVFAAEKMERKNRISVYEDARSVTSALAKGKIDVAFSPLITQILYSLTSGSFKIFAGRARGGGRVVSRKDLSENITFESSQLSTMEINFVFLREQGLDPYNVDVQYFKSPKELFNSCLEGRTEAVAIWEPYLSFLESSLKDSSTFKFLNDEKSFPCCGFGTKS